MLACCSSLHLSHRATGCAGGGSLLGDEGLGEEAGPWRGAFPPSRQSSTSHMPEREQMAGVDIVYLKNVVLKFLDAQAAGRTDQVLVIHFRFLTEASLQMQAVPCCGPAGRHAYCKYGS